MDIVARGPVLSNAEVALFLLEQKSSGFSSKTAEQCFVYLTQTLGISVQKPERVREILFKLPQNLVSNFGLSQTEVLSILNVRPQTLVDLHMAVHECDLRFSEDDQQAILDMCRELVSLS